MRIALTIIKAWMALGIMFALIMTLLILMVKWLSKHSKNDIVRFKSSLSLDGMKINVVIINMVSVVLLWPVFISGYIIKRLIKRI